MKTIRVNRNKLQQALKPAPRLCKWDGLLQAFMQHDPTAIAVFDTNMDYLFASKGFMEKYDKREQDLIGKNHYEVFPHIPQRWRDIHRRALSGEVLPELEDRIKRPDGTVDYVKWECRPWNNNDGSIGGIILFIQSMTDLKQAQEARLEREHRYQALIEQASESVFVHDTEGRFIEVNQEACDSLGYSRAEMLRLHVPEIVERFNLQRAKSAWDRMKPGSSSTLYASHKRKDGTVFPVEVRIGCIIWKKEKLFMVLARDITERKISEEKMIAAKAQAEEANHIKTQFLANMSHELRTPLNGLMGMLQLLQLTTLDDEQGNYVDLALQSSMALTDVVNDILNYTSLEKHQSLIEMPFDPDALLKEVVELHQASAVRKNLQIDYTSTEVPDTIIGDRYKIKQILNNLTGNAVKFTDSGTVRLSLETLPSKDSKRILLQFQVKDTGRGIPADRIDYIFGIFNQADDSDTRQYGGLGLGLAIVKRLTELLNGKIKVESIPDQGSCFTVTCEMRVSEETPDNELVTMTESTAQKIQRILVVDNDAAGRTVATAFAKKLGLQADTADNGREALTLIQKNAYGLILMDLQMPVMNGYETTRAIRNLEKNADKRIPILALTAKALPGVQEKCLEAGMDDYLIKPFQLDVWREKILFWLNENIANEG